MTLPLPVAPFAIATLSDPPVSVPVTLEIDGAVPAMVREPPDWFFAVNVIFWVEVCDPSTRSKTVSVPVDTLVPNGEAPVMVIGPAWAAGMSARVTAATPAAVDATVTSTFGTCAASRASSAIADVADAKLAFTAGPHADALYVSCKFGCDKLFLTRSRRL